MLRRFLNKNGKEGNSAKNGKGGKPGTVRAADPVITVPGDSWEPEGAWSDDKEILEYVQANRIRALITDHAEIVITEGVHQRLVRGLLLVVGHRMPDLKPAIYRLSPIHLQRYHDSVQAERKSGSMQEKEQSEANENVSYILGQAVDADASDVYLDIRDKKSTLSFRTFGRVRKIDVMSADIGRAVARGLFSRDPKKQWQQESPCDVSFSFQYNDREYRARVNSIPEVRGQSLSCRIRDPEYTLNLEEAGYSDHQVGLINRICRAPGGMILITGETNSGKSTTLASLMEDAPRGQRMIELADPVEMLFDHVTHIELNHYREDAENNFRNLMAAIVRQNPDCLILGEIRDEPTAAAAQQMAIQGKRVYSTLHTQGCVAAIPRLQSFGVHRHLLSLSEFIAGLVNQNLVPLVCPDCSLDTHPDIRKAAESASCPGCDGPMEPDPGARHPRLRCRNSCSGTHSTIQPEPAILERARRYEEIFGPETNLRYINPDGCPSCNHSGIVGQTLVAEVYPLGLDHGKAHEIIAEDRLWMLEEHMQEQFGIESKHDHARSKAIAGLIDPDETEAIIGEWRTSGTRPRPDMQLVEPKRRNEDA